MFLERTSHRVYSAEINFPRFLSIKYHALSASTWLHGSLTHFFKYRYTYWLACTCTICVYYTYYLPSSYIPCRLHQENLSLPSLKVWVEKNIITIKLQQYYIYFFCSYKLEAVTFFFITQRTIHMYKYRDLPNSLWVSNLVSYVYRSGVPLPTYMYIYTSKQ